ncbi:hypothetical protein K461DRAFT_289425 [Myriangium duriaei CBS 260.36]|uniref:DUF8004 domain-containing protein n=1 Tax=Myriangium duriaei CBS 260.36 TaxID=1168546 RepID=A0A9P4J8U4_9PEZI|nr:hypothetical protein K461DRAFT_289425 [Myriangium duriaei CBS 260.36]
MPTRNFSRLNSSCSDIKSRFLPTEPANVDSTFLAQGHHDDLSLDALKKPKGRRSAHILRWDGCVRESAKWDSLRRDSELFDESAEVAIHFYAEGRSQRGPSLMVSMEAIARAGCASLFETHHGRGDGCSPRSTVSTGSSTSPPASPASDSGYSSNGPDDETFNLYFPAPDHLTGDDSLSYHLTTRNLFAWIMEKPLVGFSLGQAMINLLERMLVVRSATEDSLDDCVAYAERMGYLYMTNEPDYALGMLAFAEHAGHEQIRNNAFVHCVGMNELLYLRADMTTISKHTAACITKEALRMDLKVEKVVKSLPSFFEQETDRSMLGLTVSQRVHLERFRSFLHTFYVSKYGYWPPPLFTRDVLNDIRFEFECLFELLVHREKTTESTTLLGGLCVLQNINAFDQRHGYSPLDSKLVLLPPTAALDGRSLTAKGLRGFLRSKTSRRDLLVKAQSDLAAAVNKDIPRLKDCDLVKAYLQFEHDSLTEQEPDLLIGDARKVRWIQIYYALQMLQSITSPSHPDVILTDTPHYHTCCSIPPMLRAPSVRQSALLLHPALRSSLSSAPSTPISIPTAYDIHPDCEADNYFAPCSFPRRKDSVSSLHPRPLRISSSPVLSRAATLLHRRNSLKRWHPTPLERIAPSPSPEQMFALNALDAHDLAAPMYPSSTSELEATLRLGPFELDATDNALEPVVRTAMDFAAGLRRVGSEVSLGMEELLKGDMMGRRESVSTAEGSEYSDESLDTLESGDRVGPLTPTMGGEERRVWIEGEERIGDVSSKVGGLGVEGEVEWVDIARVRR